VRPPRAPNGVNTAMVYGNRRWHRGGEAGARLEDDRHDQPVYAPVPTIRESALKAQPQNRAPASSR